MNKALKKIQIGVIGSAADLAYKKPIEKLAEEIGLQVAKAGAVLMFGAEKDCDSLPAAACRGAKLAGGLTIGITYGKGLKTFETAATATVATGLERGGGRELALILSCDAVIAVNGGSGTLNEITIAYQAGIPIVALQNSGGWSGKLAGKFLDARKKIKIFPAADAQTAVQTAIRLTQLKLKP